ncbi:MAG: beta-galactosidase trimerization domain-containing protein [Armatimonadota bacterium]
MKRLHLMLCLVIITAAVFSVTGALAVTNAEEVELEHSLKTDFVTPHFKWAKGDVRGPVKALFFIYSGSYDGTWADEGTRLREVIELSQRFDVQADAVYFGGSDKWDFHGNKFGADRAEKLLQKPYQLYVIGGFPLAKLPAKMQYEILNEVSKGAGLLCAGPGSEFMVDKRKVATPPLLADALPTIDGKNIADSVGTYQLGKGRGVWLKYGSSSLMPTKPFSYRALNEIDYWMLLVGRAAQWAANLEGQVQLGTVLGKQPARVPLLGGKAGDVVINTTISQPATLSLQLVRPDDGAICQLGDTAIQLVQGVPTVVPVTVPKLRAGDYLLNAVVRSKRGAEACGAGSLIVDSDYGVEDVTVDRSYIERGSSLEGKATVRGTFPQNSILRLRFRDSYDRLLSQQNFPIKAGQVEYPFTYTAGPFDTILMRVEAVVLTGNDEIELKTASFTVPKRRQGQFNFVMWDAPNDVLGYYAWRKLQEAGHNIDLVGSFGSADKPVTPRGLLKACDATVIPYSTRILDPKDENGYMKPVCWNHEPDVTNYVNNIVGAQKLQREQGVFVYSLGDEGVTLGCCVHPSCLAAYRKWLQGQYGTIDKLNASWSSTYKSFDEVDLLDHKDNMETASVKTNFPRWYDRQAFARHNLMQFSGRFVNAYKGLDPQAITGFEGTGGFGDDYDSIMGINPFYGPYPSIGDDIVRSGYPRERIRSNWMGYSKTGDALSDAAWRMVVKNMDSCWYWMWSGIGNWIGYIRPTFDFWEATDDLYTEMKPVREGLGDLLLKIPATDSGIAVLYSLPSALTGSLENTKDFVSPKADHEMWTQMTYDLGLDFRYVTDNMVKQGALKQGNFKVLMLPLSQALSAEQAQIIRQFVQDGGTVIADVRPGVYDEHCKPLAQGMLDDLFGIKRAARGKSVVAPVALRTELGGNKLNVSLESAKVDPDTQIVAAQALGQVDKTPLLLVNKVGKGQAILLNFAVAPSGPDSELANQTRQLLRGLYGAAGVKGVVNIAAPDGKPLPTSESRVWRNGDGLVFGSWQQMRNAWFSPKSGTVAGPPVPVKMTLPQPLHVYDLRAKKYLGKVNSLNTKLRWGRASFFAALPYKLGPTAVTLSPATPQAGQPLTATIRLGVPAKSTEKHAVYVEVTDPAGNKPLWGRQPLVVENGTATVQVPVAYNDLPGKWTVRATELFSQQSGQASWTVK